MTTPGRIGPADLEAAVLEHRRFVTDRLERAQSNIIIDDRLSQLQLNHNYIDIQQEISDDSIRANYEYDMAFSGAIPLPVRPVGDLEGFLSVYPSNDEGNSRLITDILTPGHRLNQDFGPYNVSVLTRALRQPQQQEGGGQAPAPPGHNIPPPPGGGNMLVRGNTQANPQDGDYSISQRPRLHLGGLPR